MATIYDVKRILGTLEADFSEVIAGVHTKINTWKTRLRGSDNFQTEELDQIESDIGVLFEFASRIPSMVYRYFQLTPINVSALSSELYILIDNKRVYNKKHPYIAYPPEYVFPRNPNIAQFVTPQMVSEETYKDGEDGLHFELGFAGILNVIRTVYPPYLDRVYYNFETKTWLEPPVKIVVGSNTNIVDVTPYFSNSVVNFSGNATGINDKIIYYFDGVKFITNYDFSNVEDRKKVKITYKKLLNSLRVKAVLQSNAPGLSFYTPVVDQYTLLVDKQRVLN